MFLLLLRRFRRKKIASDPVSVVSRFVDAANRHDADAIAKCLHPDFESIQPIYPSRNFRGSMQVKRNWQAIFESEPGFRLSLVRSAANDGTVWVELHGAGRDVEVAGVFIMGVEDELVRWARVYSAVVEQPAPKMATQGPETMVVEEQTSPQEEAEALRRLIDAGRPSGEGDVAADADAAWAEGADDESQADDAGDEYGDDEYEGDEEGLGDDDDESADDDDEDDESADDEDEDDESDDESDEDESDEDDADDEEDDDEEDEEDDDEEDEDSEDEDGGDEDEDSEDEVIVGADASVDDGTSDESEVPAPDADHDAFWNEGQVHDFAGSRRRRFRKGSAGPESDDDALLVDFESMSENGGGDDHTAEDPTHGRSGRRRGGRRRR